MLTICRRLDGIPLAIELAASRMASMSAAEVRDRLDDRFRLLVGSRRSLSRHQTLRHAVAWSYDLLSDSEKALLDRCSVFAGGFDLQSACAVEDSGDEYTVLDRLDALVRKSMLVADRSSGHTRYSMLETIRQFAEDQLVASGQATETRTRHARYFAGRETDIMALWDSPRQREAYDWFSIELPNLRTAFRWAADQGDLDSAATIARCAGLLGLLVEQHEPIAWAEEIIEVARAVSHPRLPSLYELASYCWGVGRYEAAIAYSEAGQAALLSGRDYALPLYGVGGGLAIPYFYSGHPERAVEWCRAWLERDRDTYGIVRSVLVIALTTAGSADEALVAANGLLDKAEATPNPYAQSMALLAYGFAARDTDPTRSVDALRRGMVVAQDSRNRQAESHLAAALSVVEAEHGDPLAALGYAAITIRNFHDAGTPIHPGLSVLAAAFDRLARYESASIIAGFAFSPAAAAGLPLLRIAIANLRNVMGDRAYESLAARGAAMATAQMVSYACDQIDQVQAELKAVSE